MADVELLELFTSHLAPPLVVAFVIPVLAEIGLWIVEPSSRSWCCRSSSRRRACRRGCWAAPRMKASACGRSSGSSARTSSTSSRARARSWRPAARRSCSTGSSASTSGSGATSISHGRRSGIEHAATDAITALAAITVVTTTAVLATNGSFDAASIPVALDPGGRRLRTARLADRDVPRGRPGERRRRADRGADGRPAARDRPRGRGGLGQPGCPSRCAAPGGVRGRVRSATTRTCPTRSPTWGSRSRPGSGSRSSVTRAPGSRRAPTCCSGCGTCATAR